MQSSDEFDWADYPVTLFLTLSNLIIYISLSLIYPSTLALNNDAILDWGQNNELVLEGELWRLVTALFVHGSVVHLMSNILFLFIFGMRCEEEFGSDKMLVGYFLSGLGGNFFTLGIHILFLSMNSSGVVNVISVGASGAVFGIFGMNLMLIRAQDKKEMRKALFIALIFFIFTISPNTNIFAHLGGLGVGLFLGFYWVEQIPKRRSKKYKRQKSQNVKRIRRY